MGSATLGKFRSMPMERSVPRAAWCGLVWTLALSVAGCEKENSTPVPEFGAAVDAPVDSEPTVIPDADDATSQPYLEPVAVGFEFDGVMLDDGTILGYWIEDDYYDAAVFIIFASEAYFSASSEEIDTVESCTAWGYWDPYPSFVELDTVDNASLFQSYEAFLNIEAHDCGPYLDPSVWGEDAEDLIGAFDGMWLGWGFGEVTEPLLDIWSSEMLREYGASMVSSYVAVSDADGGFVAEDVSTSFLFEYDYFEGGPLVDDFGQFVLADVLDYRPPESLPDVYISTSSSYFWELQSLDLDSLKDVPF